MASDMPNGKAGSPNDPVSPGFRPGLFVKRAAPRIESPPMEVQTGSLHTAAIIIRPFASSRSVPLCGYSQHAPRERHASPPGTRRGLVVERGLPRRDGA